MEKILLRVDKESLDNDTQKVNDAIREFSPFYERYKKLNVGDLKNEDLKTFLLSPKKYFLDLFTKGENLKIGELELSSEKVYELLNKPDGVDDLVNDLELKIKEPFIITYCISQVENIEIQEGKMTVKKEYLENLIEKYSSYADTENQLKALEILKRISEDFQTLIEMQIKPFYGSENSWFEHLLKKTENNKISIKPHCIKNF